LTVNTTADNTTCTISGKKSSGTCSLRGAINAANAYGQDNTTFVIKLAAKTYKLTLGELIINAKTTTANLVQIVGATTGKKKSPGSTIDGSGNAKPNSVFRVDSPTQMFNVVITGGSGETSGGDGGGIFLDSALDIENAVIKNNTACSSWVSPTPTSVHGSARGSVAASVCSTYADGGGVYMEGQHPILSLYGTTVTHNIGHYGGGIANESYNHSSVLILKSHIDGNTACSGFSNKVCISYGRGGGIYDDGENLTVESSTVNDNTAGNPAYQTGAGGGVYNREDAFQIRNSFVKRNVAGDEGGGMYINSHADIVNTEIENNVAGAGGGGLEIDYLMTMKHSQVKDNTAGGTFACTINGGTTTCQQQIKKVTGKCVSLYPSATQCSSVDGYGGGIYSDYEYPQIMSSNIDGNLAVSLSGDTNCSGGQGGGIWTSWSLSTLKVTRIRDNIAQCGGGIYNNWDANSEDPNDQTSGTHTFQLANSIISGNTALEDGGAIWTKGPGSGTLHGMTITKNHAGHQTGGVWDDQVGSVILGRGNKISKNTSPSSCKNVTWPCK
jgi:hypothetical protein